MKRSVSLFLVLGGLTIAGAARADAPVPFSSTQDVTFNPQPPNIGVYTIDCALWPAGGATGTFDDLPLAGPQYFHPGNGVPSLVERTLTDQAGNSFQMELTGIGDGSWMDEEGIHVHIRGQWRILGGTGPYRDLTGHGDSDSIINFTYSDELGWHPSTGHNEFTGQVTTSSSR